MTLETESQAEVLKDVADLRFPPDMDARMQLLMDRNTNGLLTPAERTELGALVEWSHVIGLLRARAALALGQKP